jgi:hypothetical protein
VELLETKFDFINKQVDASLKKINNTFEDLSTKLNYTNDSLNESFRDKITTIKSMVATFFAKIDSQVTNNEKKTTDIEKYFNQFQANFVNPSKELDGKLFAIKVRFEAEE